MNYQNDEFKLFTTAELAELLQISRAKVYNLVKTNEISCYEIGGSIRFSPEHIADYLNKRERYGKEN